MERTPAQTIRFTRETWGGLYKSFLFPDEETAAEKNRERRRLLRDISNRIDHFFGESKPHLGALSQGCRMCGQGHWSCLFITHLCNATCFFCPGIQTLASMKPYADGLFFDSFDDYLDYCDLFGIRGISFSGGEPFLVFDEVLAGLKSIRDRFGPDMYVWVYTNGKAVTRERLVLLRDAGLNEIRFNIGAVDYSVEKPCMAVGIADVVSVEIPMVPEDEERLQSVLFELDRAGVRHLNLHHMMAFGVNFMRLLPRKYLFTHGQAPTVIDSELGALRLIRFALNNQLDLTINYCSQVFKARWQLRGYNKRAIRFIIRSHEGETDFSYLRRIWCCCSPDEADRISTVLEQANQEPTRWSWDPEAQRLYLHHSLLEPLMSTGILLDGGVGEGTKRLQVQYYRPVIANSGPQTHSPVAGQVATDIIPLRINDHIEISVSTYPVCEAIDLDCDKVQSLIAWLNPVDSKPPADALSRLQPYEVIPNGLPDYL